MDDDTLTIPDPRAKSLFRILVFVLVVGAFLLGVLWLQVYTDPIERYQRLLQEAVAEWVALTDAQDKLLSGVVLTQRSAEFDAEWAALTLRWEALDARVTQIDNPPEFEQTHEALLRSVHEYTLAAQAVRDAPSSGAYEIHIDEARLAGVDSRDALEAESRPFTTDAE
jgi:hypothetical protein